VGEFNKEAFSSGIKLEMFRGSQA